MHNRFHPASHLARQKNNNLALNPSGAKCYLHPSVIKPRGGGNSNSFKYTRQRRNRCFYICSPQQINRYLSHCLTFHLYSHFVSFRPLSIKEPFKFHPRGFYDSSPLMTGVKTAMPAKFGLVTVLSRIKPPTLKERRICERRAESWRDISAEEKHREPSHYQEPEICML